MIFKLPILTKEYRPELNGLRGLAVVLVLLFHLDFEWMQGGFLGVDVFLVISGYFISRNILSELQQERFSFFKFYTKRLRRLFPALLVTLLLVLIAGFVWLTPSNFERLAQSTIFSSFSVSNFFFWSESGYFNVASETKPLLHMWSLSLEEQFYLFWPLLLTLFFKSLRRYVLPIILVLVVGSLVLAEVFLTNSPDAVFFLIPFRMFEFLLGACCIWLERYEFKKWKGVSELLFLMGITMMVYSAIAFDKATPMPSFLSLIPCVGAMLIIFAGKAPIASWLLKNKVVEYIGKSSYSIYLIHWPIIVYYKYVSFDALGINQQLIIGGSSIVLGFLMWYFVENTFRYPKKKSRRLDRVWIGVPTSIIVLSLCAAMVWRSNGMPSRYTRELFMTQEEILANRKQYWQDSRSKRKVLKGEPGKGHALIMGNSHAIDIIYALRLNGLQAKITSLQTSVECYNFGAPILEVDSELCQTKYQSNMSNENWSKTEVIYLHDHWPQLDIEGLKVFLSEVRKKTNVPVFVFGPKMIYREQVPEIIRTSGSYKAAQINDYAWSFAQNELKIQINEGLKSEFNHQSYAADNIYYIDVLSIQGGKNLDQFEIVSKDDLKFLYFDATHFTEQGAKEFGEKLKQAHPYLFDMAALKNQFNQP